MVKIVLENINARPIHKLSIKRNPNITAQENASTKEIKQMENVATAIITYNKITIRCRLPRAERASSVISDYCAQSIIVLPLKRSTERRLLPSIISRNSRQSILPERVRQVSPRSSFINSRFAAVGVVQTHQFRGAKCLCIEFKRGRRVLYD